ncbi:MAG: hypothetical protein FWD57_13465, partial [Polyangiaceae bacterium]|nr:hypothetical protein [Polyangiaceae bacterium]
EQYCAAFCGGIRSCQDGFICREDMLEDGGGLCLKDRPPAAADDSDDSGGCSQSHTSSGPTSARGLWIGLAIAVGLLFRRSRASSAR